MYPELASYFILYMLAGFVSYVALFCCFIGFYVAFYHEDEWPEIYDPNDV